MKAFGGTLALAMSVAVAIPASAQVLPGTAAGQGTPYNNGGTFGNNGLISPGAFVNVFTFIVTQAGSLTSSFSNTGVDGTNTDIDFANGSAGFAGSLTGPTGFAPATYTRVLNDPLPEVYNLSISGVPVNVGTYTLTVRGTSLGSAATYAGTFLVATAPGAVPEPATWAMMIGGIGLAGVGLRRRKQAKISKVAFA